MGEYYQKIAAPDVVDDAVAPAGERLLSWLVDRRVVLREQRDCVLRSDGGFPPGEAAESALAPGLHLGWRKYTVTGVELITRRTVFYNLEQAQSSICSVCKQENGPDFFQTVVFPIIDDWYACVGETKVGCIRCQESTDLRHWRFDPVWAFADLGLTFWNWPMLSARFVEELSEVTGSRVVYQADKL